MVSQVQMETAPTKVTIVQIWHAGISLFRFLLSRWWLIMLVVVLAGLAGYTIAYLQKPKYQSNLTFALDDGGGGMGGAISLAAEFGLNLGGSSNLFEGDNILPLLTSRRIVEGVLLSVDTFGTRVRTMADYYLELQRQNKKIDTSKMSVKERRIANISFPVGQSRKDFSYLQDSVLLTLAKDFTQEGALEVSKPDKKLNLYQINVTSLEERFSKVFTDKLIVEATDFYTELRSRKSKQTLEILEERVNQTKGNLRSAITKRATIRDADINPAFQKSEAEIQKQQVDISAYGGAYGELYKNLELARFQYLKDIPLLQIIDDANYPMKKIKKGKAITAITYAFIAGLLITILLSVVFFMRHQLSKNRSPI